MNKIIPICLVIVTIALVVSLIQESKWHKIAQHWFDSYNQAQESSKRFPDIVSGDVYGITVNNPPQGKATSTLLYLKKGCSFIEPSTVDMGDWHSSLSVVGAPYEVWLTNPGDNVYTTKCK